MNQPRQPDNVESADEPLGPDHCSLLDEYWDALRRESESDLVRLIKRDRPDGSIASDLEVLNLLHQARRKTRADGEVSSTSAAWLSESFPRAASSLAKQTGAPTTPLRGEGPEAPEVPERIGKYLVVERLDHGGQAQVFRVLHPELRKECVLKLARRPMANEGQAGRDALLREGRLLAQCEHPNLVRVLDLDVHEGRWFFVMEYFPALTLVQFVARNRPGPRQAAQLVIELSRAVAYLHARGITHQDIKPQNVLVDEQGRPRLIDLGMARQNHAWRDDADDWTSGTASYMSPEQATGSADLIGPRTDVFGLGGVLYHLLTGRPLYVASSQAATSQLARQADYIPIHELNPRVPRALERICHKALAADPELRYATAAEMGRDLRRYVKRPLIAATGLAALVTLAAAAWFMFRMGSQPTTFKQETGLAVRSPLKVLEFKGVFSRKRVGRDSDVSKRIDPSTQLIREGDEVTVTGKLDASANFYVIAATPDGKTQLYWPRTETELPSKSAQIGTDERVFDLTEGPGLQAFVLLASRKQLPPFKDWQGRNGLEERWKQVAGDGFDGVWDYRDGELRASLSTFRSPREKYADARLAPFRKFCEYLGNLPDFEVIRAFGFAVKTKPQFLVDDHARNPESDPKLATTFDAKGKEPVSAPKPPWQRLLQGDDAKRVAELDKAIEAALKADRWDEAIARGEELVAWRSRVQGPKHYETVNDEWRLKTSRKVASMPHEDRAACQSAVTASEQAKSLEDHRKYAEAEPLHRKALEICQRLLTDDNPQTATNYDNLAANLHAQETLNFPEQLALYGRAMEIRQRLLTDEHPETAESYGNVAYILKCQGKYAQAQPLFEKALEISRKMLSDDHPKTAMHYNNLAGNVREQGMYAQAQPLFEKALEINRRILTDEHSDTATYWNNLANNLNAQGKYAEAEPLHRKALAIRQRLLTDDDLLTTKSYNDLAVNLNAQGRYAEAQPLLEKALKINGRILPDNHARTALACSNLGENLGAQGKYAEAQGHLKRALDMRLRVLTDDHPDTAESYENLATNLDAQGEYTQAQRLHEKSLGLFRRLLFDEHPGTIRGYDGLAKNLNAQGKYREAQVQWQQGVKSLDRARLRVAFAGLERAGNMKSPRAALAAVLARLGQPEAAWQTLDKDMGRGLLDELAARRDRPFIQAERDRLRELTTELGRLDRLVESIPQGIYQNGWAKQFEDLKRQRELASIALGDFLAKLAHKYGDLEGHVASLVEIQAALPADTALVAWVDIPPVGPNAADSDGEHWGVVVRSRGVPSWVPIAGTGSNGLWSKDDTELASQVRTELRKRPDADPVHLWRLIGRLRTQRLEPLAQALGAATADGLPPALTLIVLPSHDLAGIPVEALLDYNDTRTVSYAPSATVFNYLRARPRPDRHAGLLALGDPIYQRPDKSSDPEPPDHGLLVKLVVPGSNAATRGLKQGDVLLSYNATDLFKPDDLKTVAESGRPVPVEFWRDGKIDRLELASGKLDVEFDHRPIALAIADQRESGRMLTAARSGSEEFDRLPWSRKEVDAMVKLFQSDDRPTRVLLGADASESELDRVATTGELRRFTVIHLATHAVINEGIPARSAAILTQTGLPDPTGAGPQQTAGFDGRLSVHEIQRGWELNAELVTLSACETALGRDSGGEGFVGFTQALLMSGARSVCLSLWKVDDRATSLLMTRFYQNWLGKRPGLDKPLSKAKALREAKQWLRAWSDEDMKLSPDQIPRGPREKPKSVTPAAARPFEHPFYWAGFILVGDPS